MNRRVCVISLVREERADRSAIADASARSVRGVFMGGVFVDPGKYEFYSCEQIGRQPKRRGGPGAEARAPDGQG
jgi:hypothetical protein